MTAVAVELLTRPPNLEDAPEPDTLIDDLDPEAIEFIADTDDLLTMCSCTASSDQVY